MSARHAGLTVLATSLAWLIALGLVVTTSAIDLSRAGHAPSLARLAAGFIIGFAPWLVLAPYIVQAAWRDARRGTPLLPSIGRGLVLAATCLGAILVYLIVAYAPLTGQSVGQALESQQLTQWWWDVSFFSLAYLAGRLRGAAQLTRHTGPGRIAVRSPERLEFVSIGDLIAVTGQGNYAALISRERDILHRATLNDLDRLLTPHGFIRIHRSHLVRPDAVTGARMKAGKPREVSLPGGKRLPVSETYADRLAEHLDHSAGAR